MVKKHKDHLYEIGIPGGISILTGKAGMEELTQALRNKCKNQIMETTRIDIELISLKHQKVLDGKAFIELRNKTLRFKAFVVSERPVDTDDLSLGMRECNDEWDI